MATGRSLSFPEEGSELERLRGSDEEQPVTVAEEGGDAADNGGGSRSSTCCATLGLTFGIFLKYVIGRTFGLFLYILDIFTDVMAALSDYKNGDLLFGSLTVGFIFVPGVLFALYSMVNVRLSNTGFLRFAKRALWLVASPLLPLWPVFRDLHQIYHGLVATLGCSRTYHLECLNKPSQAYLQKFLEAFTEAAPQVLLRLYRIALRGKQFPFTDLETVEIVQVTMSLVSLSMKMVSTHQKNVTTSLVVSGDLDDHAKFKLPCIVQITGFLWWMCFLMSRFEAMALFTETYHAWIILVVGIHIVLIFLFQTAATHKNLIKRIAVYIFSAFVFIFAYLEFNVKKRLKVSPWLPYIIFSSLVFLENSVMVILWLVAQQDLPVPEGVTVEQLQEHRERLIFIHYGTFTAGVIFMIICFCCAPHTETEEPETKPNPKPQQQENEI